MSVNWPSFVMGAAVASAAMIAFRGRARGDEAAASRAPLRAAEALSVPSRSEPALQPQVQAQAQAQPQSQAQLQQRPQPQQSLSAPLPSPPSSPPSADAKSPGAAPHSPTGSHVSNGQRHWRILRHTVQAVAGFKPDPLHDLEPQRALQLAGDPKQVPAAAATVRGRKTARAPNVFFVVLTGGPCGGKTTSLNSFSQELSARGFDVYCAPETPTIMLNGGCKFPGTEGGQALLEFETALMKLQMQMEDSFLQVAHSTGRPSVIVLDRSLIDVAAYLQSRDWIRILKSNGWDERHFFDRYDLVVHLVTAAEGAEEYYTSANNTARRESPVEARTLDQRIRQCYAHHPRLRVIDNSTDFKAKVERATHSILELLHDGSH